MCLGGLRLHRVLAALRTRFLVVVEGKRSFRVTNEPNGLSAFLGTRLRGRGVVRIAVVESKGEIAAPTPDTTANKRLIAKDINSQRSIHIHYKQSARGPRGLWLKPCYKAGREQGSHKLRDARVKRKDWSKNPRVDGNRRGCENDYHLNSLHPSMDKSPDHPSSTLSAKKSK